MRIRLLALLKVLLVVAALAQPAAAQDAASLRERHAALQKQLADNAFRRPLYIESSQAASSLRSDVYAVVDAPYAKAAAAPCAIPTIWRSASAPGTTRPSATRGSCTSSSATNTSR